MHRGEGLLLYHLVNFVKPFVVKMHWSSNLRYPQLSLLQPYPVSICKKKLFVSHPRRFNYCALIVTKASIEIMKGSKILQIISRLLNTS
jgi:hypothetical protein